MTLQEQADEINKLIEEREQIQKECERSESEKIKKAKEEVKELKAAITVIEEDNQDKENELTDCNEKLKILRKE